MTELSRIKNFLWIDDSLATSGQPTPEQFALIARSGFERVVNLLPDDSDAYWPGEEDLASNLGMSYCRIAVSWRYPTDDDFSEFCQIMDFSHGKEKLFVHCAANMRVSAFIYLWRLKQGNDEADAAADLRDIWVPDGVWATFIERVKRRLYPPLPLRRKNAGNEAR